MNMAANIIEFKSVTAVPVLLADARRSKGYSLDDMAETSGLTVSEIVALESGKDQDRQHIRRMGSALGLPLAALGI